MDVIYFKKEWKSTFWARRPALVVDRFQTWWILPAVGIDHGDYHNIKRCCDVFGIYWRIEESGIYKQGDKKIRKFRKGNIDKPRTPQPFTRTKVTDEIIQKKNKLLCDLYNEVTKDALLWRKDSCNPWKSAGIVSAHSWFGKTKRVVQLL